MATCVLGVGVGRSALADAHLSWGAVRCPFPVAGVLGHFPESTSFDIKDRFFEGIPRGIDAWPSALQTSGPAPTPQQLPSTDLVQPGALDVLAPGAKLCGWLGYGSLAEEPTEADDSLGSDSLDDAAEGADNGGWGRLTTADPWGAHPSDAASRSGVPVDGLVLLGGRLACGPPGPAPARQLFGPSAAPVPEQWPPEPGPNRLGAGARGSAGPRAPAAPGVVTVMMRNLPNKYTRDLLVEEIGNAGFRDAFDFVYLPTDPATGANRGYAFINFVSCAAAGSFSLAYEGRRMERFNSNKRVSLTPASLQGLEANRQHFSTAPERRGAPPRAPAPGGPSAARGRRRRSGNSLIDQAKRRAEQAACPSAAAPGGGQRGPAGAQCCPRCGGAVLAQHRFCSFCGTQAAPTAPAAPA